MTKEEVKRAFSGQEKRVEGEVFGVPKGFNKGIWVYLKDVPINSEGVTLGAYIETLKEKDNHLSKEIENLRKAIATVESRINDKINEIVKGKVV